MTTSIELGQLAPAQRASLIYSYARLALSDDLWRAALGESAPTGGAGSASAAANSLSIDGVMTMLRDAFSGTGRSEGAAAPADAGLVPSASPSQATPISRIGSLGPNQRYQPDLNGAAMRTGIPAPALAAIINAEAGRAKDGSWLTYSRNSRSSAAGLGQFLSGTWIGMAEMKGSWLNATARAKGWLGPDGRIAAAAQSALLSLRYDATASINAVADYARYNIEGLRRRGVAIGSDITAIARTAYVSHYLGLGDAARFLTSELDQARARTLLDVQIGSHKAQQRIAAAGNAAAAHRAWFLEHLQRNLRPDLFAA